MKTEPQRTLASLDFADGATQQHGLNCWRSEFSEQIATYAGLERETELKLFWRTVAIVECIAIVAIVALCSVSR